MALWLVGGLLGLVARFVLDAGLAGSDVEAYSIAAAAAVGGAAAMVALERVYARTATGGP
jgi:hypothetical protein